MQFLLRILKKLQTDKTLSSPQYKPVTVSTKRSKFNLGEFSERERKRDGVVVFCSDLILVWFIPLHSTHIITGHKGAEALLRFL